MFDISAQETIFTVSSVKSYSGRTNISFRIKKKAELAKIYARNRANKVIDTVFDIFKNIDIDWKKFKISIFFSQKRSSIIFSI